MALDYIIYIISCIITFLILFLAYYRFWFLRKPERRVPKGKNRIVSPANGRISRIISVNGESVDLRKGVLGKVRAMTKDTAGKAWLITIVMNPFNVHYQRAPADCRIISTRHRKGKLHNAMIGAKNLNTTFENERNEILMKSGKSRLKVIQIAGVFARRIKCDVSKNQNIKKGNIIGSIRFGSQVCLVLPRNSKTKLLASEGQYVVDGETVLAEKR